MPDGKSKLYVDVTCTIKTEWHTGIQRVVRNISSEFTATNFPTQKIQPILCFSDRQKYFIQATISSDKTISVNKWLGERIRDFSAADRIFMLDSSWEFYKNQHKILRRAKLAGTQVFSCLYDMVPLRIPALCHPGAPAAYAPWFESALSISDGFVCISKAVADEFLVLLKAIDFPRKMKVGYWPLGADIGKSAGFPRPPRDPSRKLPNFLVVGTIEPRKNHLLVLDAFGELWSQGYEGTLTLLGRRGWSCGHIVQAIERNPELGRKLNWVRDADDDELGAAYWSHDILIAPSHAEGFGLPVVEALQHGCQILASDIPVFREVAGNSPSVQYFEPNSKLSLMGKIKTASAKAPADQAAVPPTWVNWEQSTAMLADVVVDDHWYTEFTPSTVESIPSETIGNTRMTKQLSRDDTRHRLELIGPAIFSQDRKSVKYAVKVSNDTAQFFSSRGLPGGSMGIFLGCHAVSQNGEVMDFKGPQSAIPFILPPNDSVYLPIEIVLKKLPSRAAFIDIEMLQEGVGWWGNPLRVPLDL
jgi:glycosyltransferase involved in cell wall biosynthesis